MAFWTMPLPGLMMRKANVALPVFVASSQATATSAPSVVFNKPGGVQSGDLMVVVVASNGIASPTISGWTLQYVTANDPFLAVFSKVAGGSEPSTYTYNPGGGSPDSVIVCLAYRGGSAIFDQVGVRSTSVTANPATAPSITTSNQGILIAAFVARGNSVVISGPSGMTSREGTVATTLVNLALYDLSPSPAGVTGNKTADWHIGSFPRAGLQLQIR